MNVLSLFDGISCGRLALERAGIPVKKYYASEIDKYAIQVAQKNYPDTIQVGDVTKLNYLELLDVDMVIGGSPCQDLSIAKQNREGLRGARSGLFWKYVEALEVIHPKWFLLENVASMRNEDRDAITETLKRIYPETECIMINSALVSAQQRKRYYWTNWHVEQPQDKGILLKDILESGYGCDVENQGKELCKTVDKTQTLMARDYKGFGNQRMTGVIEPLVPFVESKLPDIEKKFGELPQMFNPYNKQKITDKAPIQTTGCGSQTTSSTVMMFEPVCINIPEPVVVRKYPVNIEKLKILLRSHKNQTNKEIADALNVSTTKVEHWFRTDDCFAIPDPDIWFALKDLLHIETDEFDASITEFETKDAVYEKAQRKYHIDGKMSTLTTSTNDEIIAPQRIGQIGKGGQGGRIYSVRGKSVCLNANGGGGGAKTGLYKVDLPDGDYIIRKLTPVECERLQTLPDNWTEGVSNTQRYKAIGNGWTVDVIAWIFSQMPQ
jgi:DNA-cytosine methyltransferase